MRLPKLLQIYMERNTTCLISDQVEGRTQDSRFLSSAVCDEIAHIERREVKFGKCLGQGSFSKVYEMAAFKTVGKSSNFYAKKRSLKTAERSSNSYAIKEIRQPRCRDFFAKDNKILFQKYARDAADAIMEAKYLAAFDHPNIIKVRGLGIAAMPFIIVDRLDDETLAGRIHRWRQDAQAGASAAVFGDILSKKADYALQIANAMKYLHDRRIIIRDLKPSNIGFSRRGVEKQEVVQLFDFGLCRELPSQIWDTDSSPSFQMSIAGTTRYMAVEVVNTGFYGLSADVYSFAVICYEMMTLEVAFASVRSPSMYKRLVCRGGERPIFPESANVPTIVQELICSGWAQDANDRPDMAEICKRLEKLMHNGFKALPTLMETPSAPNTKMSKSATTSVYSVISTVVAPQASLENDKPSSPMPTLPTSMPQRRSSLCLPLDSLSTHDKSSPQLPDSLAHIRRIHSWASLCLDSSETQAHTVAKVNSPTPPTSYLPSPTVLMMPRAG